jgi:hypothetical protein
MDGGAGAADETGETEGGLREVDWRVGELGHWCGLRGFWGGL